MVQVSDGTLIDTQAIAVTVTNVNEVAAGDDIVLSNFGGGAYSIPEWALLRNDINEAGTLDISGVVSQSGLQSANHTPGVGSNGSVNVDDNGTGGTGSFIYTAQAGATTDNAQANITNLNGGDFTGTVAAEILIGDGNGDTFDGGGGVDIILAGGGDDTIVADQSDHVIDGGGGTDTLESPRTSPAAAMRRSSASRMSS